MNNIKIITTKSGGQRAYRIVNGKSIPMKMEQALLELEQHGENPPPSQGGAVDGQQMVKRPAYRNFYTNYRIFLRGLTLEGKPEPDTFSFRVRTFLEQTSKNFPEKNIDLLMEAAYRYADRRARIREREVYHWIDESRFRRFNELRFRF